MKNNQQKQTLNAEPRTLQGKKVNQLRRKGLIPANIFGPGIEPSAITVTQTDFMNVYKIAHETSVVYVQLNGKEVPTLIRDIQIHPLSSLPLHVDFRKVDLTQKIETTVPVHTIGTSEAVAQKGGVLLTQRDHLTIEVLPTQIPSAIEVDISKLKEIGDEFTVADLPTSPDYRVLDEQDDVIVSVVAHKEESTIAETTAATPEVLTEKPAEERAEAPADQKNKE